jgi:hypothetical protein
MVKRIAESGNISEEAAPHFALAGADAPFSGF